jgi:N-acetyl-anhydromuramyl-L-alanine amidase AmpD
MEELDLSTLVQVDFPEDQYYKEETDKKQIVLHHTVSGPKADGVISWWKQDPLRVATHFIIQGDGTIYQVYSSKYWAHHLGIKSDFIKTLGFVDYGSRNTTLNKESVGIEVCRWGGLLKNETGYHPAYWDANLKKEVCNTKITIPDENVQVFEKPFRGYYFFEKYTPEQIDSLGKLVNYLCDKWGIPKTYNDDMWDVSKNAMGSNPGIYTHVSYRKDKSDMFPQDEIISMIESLSE